jgi:nitrogen fixation protein NifX
LAIARKARAARDPRIDKPCRDSDMSRDLFEVRQRSASRRAMHANHPSSGQRGTADANELHESCVVSGFRHASARSTLMSQPPFSNEVALRIGLAARRLPTISVTELIEVLHGCLGETLDERALSRVTVANLKAAFGQSHDVDGDEDGEALRTADLVAFKDAVSALWGEARAEDDSPLLDAYQTGDMPRSVRVAVASNSGEALDGHFGSCQRFLIYQVSADELRLIDVRPTLAAALSDDRNGFRVQLIRDCAVLYIVSVGGPAAAKVIKANIHLVPTPNGGAAREVLQKLQAVIPNSPPPWLAKLLGVDPEQRLKHYAEHA